jgi:predicted PurR-regulated permease PerM
VVGEDGAKKRGRPVRSAILGKAERPLDGAARGKFGYHGSMDTFEATDPSREPDHPSPDPAPTSVTMTGALWTLTQLVVVTWGLIAARPFWVPVLLAALLAFIATPLVRMLRRMRVPETLAITLTVVIFAIPFGLVAYAIVREIQALTLDWPTIVSSTKQYLAQMSHNPWAIRFHLNENLNFSALQETFVNRAGEGVQIALVGLGALLDASSTLFLILMFSILMVALRAELEVGAKNLIGTKLRAVSATNLIEEVASLIQSFLMARFIVVVVVAALATVVLFAFGVKYALLLGGILGVATLIPNIGFLLGMLPSFGVALATGHSLGQVALMFLVFLGLALFEANLLVPKLVGGKLNINSLVAFLGLFAGGLMWGVWGMLLSIPLLGIARICLNLSAGTRPWAELLAEREDDHLLRRLVRIRPSAGKSE